LNVISQKNNNCKISKYNFLNKANDTLNADLTSYAICIKIIFFTFLATSPAYHAIIWYIRHVSHEFIQRAFDPVNVMRCDKNILTELGLS
jgi:hypothetical protein